MCILDCLLVLAIIFYMYKAKIWMGVVTSLQPHKIPEFRLSGIVWYCQPDLAPKIHTFRFQIGLLATLNIFQQTWYVLVMCFVIVVVVAADTLAKILHYILCDDDVCSYDHVIFCCHFSNPDLPYIDPHASYLGVISINHWCCVR